MVKSVNLTFGILDQRYFCTTNLLNLTTALLNSN